MIFVETKNLNLCVPSKDNLPLWSKWINSSFVRKTVVSTRIPKTLDMQWNWIESELSSENRILLEICDKIDNTFLGVVSLSSINYKRRSAQIATIYPQIKNKKNRYGVYEARIAISQYAFQELSLNKVWGAMEYPKNESFMVNNMCIGFEIEGINHDSSWYNNIPAISVNYFITRSIFEKKKIFDTNLEILLSKTNRISNKKKLSEIISYLKFS